MGKVPEAHTCNPSYSGGTDQEDHCSKPAYANSSKPGYAKQGRTTVNSKQKQEGNQKYKTLHL
jgi:hypothetical protein